MSLEVAAVELPTPDATWKWYIVLLRRFERFTECEVVCVSSSVEEEPYAFVVP
jgi:hypothetical protein